MKRRTYRKLRVEQQPEHHHNVYVVLLDPAAGRLRAVRAANPKRDPKKPCVYVGMTGLTPEERFANHKAGIKDASLVNAARRANIARSALVNTPRPSAMPNAGRRQDRPRKLEKSNKERSRPD